MNPLRSSLKLFVLINPPRRVQRIPRFAALALGFALWNAAPAPANVAGGGDGTGPSVTITEKDKWIILSNGICTINITKTGPRLDALDYTYNNNGMVRTSQTLKGPGQYYYGGFSMGGLDMAHQNASAFKSSIAVNPGTNGGNYGDVMMVSDTPNLGVIEVHFSMLRGSPGFYSTAIQTHRAQDLPVNLTAWGGRHAGAGHFQLVERR